MLTARLIGAAWRTAVLEEDRAAAELEKIGQDAPQLLPQAAAVAARFWTGRADEGLCDIDRAKTAAGRARRLAVDANGNEVTPTVETEHRMGSPHTIRPPRPVRE